MGCSTHILFPASLAAPRGTFMVLVRGSSSVHERWKERSFSVGDTCSHRPICAGTRRPKALVDSMADFNLDQAAVEQAKLNVQVSEEIRRYADEVSRLSAEGRIEFQHGTHATNLVIPTKAGLEKDRESTLRKVTSGVSKTAFEPTVVNDALQHSILSAGEKRNTTPTILNLLQRFFANGKEEMIMEKMALHQTYHRYGQGTEFVERHAQAFVERHTEASKVYKEYGRRLLAVSNADGLPPSLQDLEEYIKYLYPRQTLSMMTAIFTQKLHCLDIRERSAIYRMMSTINRDRRQEEEERGKLTGRARKDTNAPVLSIEPRILSNRSNECIAGLNTSIPTTTESSDGDGAVLYQVKSLFDEFFESQNDFWAFEENSREEWQDEAELDEEMIRIKKRKDAASQNKQLRPANWTHAAHSCLSHAMMYSRSREGSGSEGIARSTEDEDLKLESDEDTILRVEQEFLNEKKLSVVKQRLQNEIASHAQRMTVRKIFDGSKATLLKDNAEAVFERLPPGADEVIIENFLADLDVHSETNRSEEGGKDHSASGGNEGNYSVPLLRKGLHLSAELNNKVEILYHVRHLRARKVRNHLFATLNYFRAVQRRLTLDSLGIVFQDKIDESNSGVQTTNPLTFSVSRQNRLPSDMVRSNEDFIDTMEVENRDDVPELYVGIVGDEPIWRVKDPYGLSEVIYDATEGDFRELENIMLKLGSKHVNRLELNEANDVVDRAQVLLDLYESEAAFQFEKSLLTNAYLNIYHHMIHRAEQQLLRDEIVRLMSWQPNFDSSTLYFKESFEKEIDVLKKQRAFYEQALADQISLERDFLDIDHSAVLYRLPETMVVRRTIGNVARLVPELEHSMQQFQEIDPAADFANDVALRSLFWTLALKSWSESKTQYHTFTLMSSGEYNSHVAAILANGAAPTWDSVELATKQIVEASDSSVMGSSKQLSPPLQVLYNVIEGLLLREELISNYVESEEFRSCYEAQRMAYGKDIVDHDCRERDKGYKLAKEAGVLGAHSEVKPAGGFATDEFDYTLENLNFATNAGLKEVFSLADEGLARLRIAVKLQVLERCLLLVAIRQNQMPLDALQKMESSNANTLTFITEAEKHTRRIKIRNISDKLRPQFLSLHFRKNAAKEIVWASFALRSKPLLKSRAFSHEEIEEQVQEIKYGLIADYCTTMFKDIGPETLRQQICHVADNLAHLTAPLRKRCLEDYEDSIFYTRDQQFSGGQSKSTVITMFDPQGTINNVWYIPNREELYQYWDQDQEMTNSARNRRLATMEHVLHILTGMRDLYILVQARCTLVAPSKQAGDNVGDVIFDAMKYEFMKIKFQFEQYEEERSNQGWVTEVWRYRTFYFLILRTAMDELYDQATGCLPQTVIPKLDDWVPEHLAALQYFVKSAINVMLVRNPILSGADGHLDFAIAQEGAPDLIKCEPVGFGTPHTHHEGGLWGCEGGGSRWFWQHHFKVTTISNAIAIANLEEAGPERGPGYCVGPYVGALEIGTPRSLQALLKHISSCAGAIQNFSNGALTSLELKLDALHDRSGNRGVAMLKWKIDHLVKGVKIRSLKRQIYAYKHPVPRCEDEDTVAAAFSIVLTKFQVIHIRKQYDLVLKAVALEDEGHTLRDADKSKSMELKAMATVCNQLKMQLAWYEDRLKAEARKAAKRVEEAANSVNSRVAERCYALIFSVDSCNRTIRQLRRDLVTQSEDITNKVRAEFIDEISRLKLQNVELRGKFSQYQETMKRSMLGELSEAKKNTLEKIMDSDLTTIDLKKRSVKIATAEDEILGLKRDLSELNSEYAFLKAKAESDLIEANRDAEKKLEGYREKAAGSATLWARMNEIESREDSLKKELVAAQTASSELFSELKNVRQELRMTNRSKSELQRWKVNNMHAMKDLQKQIHVLRENHNRPESPKSVGHDQEVPHDHPLRRELHRASQAVIQLKRDFDREKKAKRAAFTQIARMNERETLRNQMMEAKESTRHTTILEDDYNDLQKDFSALAAQNERLRSLLRDHNLPVPGTVGEGPKQLSEREDWKFKSSAAPDTMPSNTERFVQTMFDHQQVAKTAMSERRTRRARPKSAGPRRNTFSNKLGSTAPPGLNRTLQLVVQNRTGPNSGADPVSPLSKRKTRVVQKLLKLSGKNVTGHSTKKKPRRRPQSAGVHRHK